jgi:hypothetical protein
MKIELAPNKELVVKTKADLIKHKEELQAEDIRKQKIVSDLKITKDSEPELTAFARSIEVQLTPIEEYAIIDNTIENW